jgi:hypothetical protein
LAGLTAAAPEMAVEFPVDISYPGLREPEFSLMAVEFPVLSVLVINPDLRS